jgi:hypothetical protein
LQKNEKSGWLNGWRRKIHGIDIIIPWNFNHWNSPKKYEGCHMQIFLLHPVCLMLCVCVYIYIYIYIYSKLPRYIYLGNLLGFVFVFIFVFVCVFVFIWLVFIFACKSHRSLYLGSLYLCLSLIFLSIKKKKKKSYFLVSTYFPCKGHKFNLISNFISLSYDIFYS